MEWVRGESIGFGSFSTVNLAILKQSCSASAQFPSLMAVKSCEVSSSGLLENEEGVLKQLGDCPQVIRCFGDDRSAEKGLRFYNLLLEYASEGSLADHVKKSGGKFQESEAKIYTRSILKGLRHIHAKGFAHCDIKIQNILKFSDGEVKIADFGLAKKTGEKLGRIEVRGTPLYMSPESVNENEYEPPCDVWALGCAVVEMVTGRPPWDCKPGKNVAALLIKIGVTDELPGIPEELSNEGKDFVSKCFVKDRTKRWTAEMLLGHPFVAKNDAVDDDTVALEKAQEFPTSSSPRGPFDFPDCSVHSSTEESELWYDKEEKPRFDSLFPSRSSSPAERIRQLVSDEAPERSDSGDWITVR